MLFTIILSYWVTILSLLRKANVFYTVVGIICIAICSVDMVSIWIDSVAPIRHLLVFALMFVCVFEVGGSKNGRIY